MINIMLRPLPIFFISFAVLVGITAGIGLDDITNIVGNPKRGRCRNDESVCKAFCKKSQCRRNVCICVTDWTEETECDTYIPDRRCTRRAAEFGGCPFMCEGRDRKNYCVVWLFESNVAVTPGDCTSGIDEGNANGGQGDADDGDFDPSRLRLKTLNYTNLNI